MGTPIDDFDALMQEFYPGSKKPIVRDKNEVSIPNNEEIGWDKKPRYYNIAGVKTEFFTAANLAEALGRKTATIRKWETDGVIPKATFQTPSTSSNGRRRLYTRGQVEGIVQIAREEKMLEQTSKAISIKSTKFSARVLDLFKRLASEGKGK